MEGERWLLDRQGNNKTFLLLSFPEQKAKIAKLTLDEKMEWYAHQFQTNAQEATISLSTPEFARFWKWRVLIPTKVKRFYYRCKNGEIFKRYEHITEIKKRLKKTNVHLI